MCNSKINSLIFASLGFGTSYYFYRKQKNTKRYIQHIHLPFYSLMELLQYIQYFVVDDCNNIINKYSTSIAYILVWSQPIMFNYRFYKIMQNNKKVFYYNFILSVFVFMFAMDRVFFNLIHKYPIRIDEISANDQLCVFKGTTHLYWGFPMKTNRGFEIGYMWYLLLNTLPSFWAYGIIKGLFYNIVFLSGMLSGYIITNGNLEENMAYWCFISVPYILTGILGELTYDLLMPS